MNHCFTNHDRFGQRTCLGNEVLECAVRARASRGTYSKASTNAHVLTMRPVQPTNDEQAEEADRTTSPTPSATQEQDTLLQSMQQQLEDAAGREQQLRDQLTRQGGQLGIDLSQEQTALKLEKSKASALLPLTDELMQLQLASATHYVCFQPDCFAL